MKYFYALISILFAKNIFCQDTIVMRDNSKLIAKVLEISSTEVKYKRFDNIEGPDYVINKNDVSSITYNNGLKDAFEIASINSNADNIFINPTPPKGSEKRETKVGDYIKFNVQAGAVIYNSYCNVPRRDQIAMTSSYEYKKISDKENSTFNIGFNFIFGNNPYIKHVIGVNYLRTQGEFIYDWGYIGASSYSKYKSIIDYVNLTSGPRFSLANKIHIDPLIAINIAVHSKTTHSGTKTTFDYQTPPYTRYTSTFENKPTSSLVGTTISLAPRIGYEIPIKSHKAEFFIPITFLTEQDSHGILLALHTIHLRNCNQHCPIKKYNF